MPETEIAKAASTASEVSSPQPTEFHWVMTVQSSRGALATYDGQIPVVPGVHTPQSTYAALRKHMADTLGIDQFVVLFYSIKPNRF